MQPPQSTSKNQSLGTHFELDLKHLSAGPQLMAKPRQRHLVAISGNKNNTPSSPDVDLPGEDSWVMVKKQKVNILIPPLPVTAQSTMPEPEPSQLQPRPRITINAESQCPIKTYPQMHSVFEIEKPMSLAPENAIPTVRKVPFSHPISTFSQLPRQDHRMGPEKSQADSFGCRKTLGFCSTSKVSKRSISFFDGGMLLNQRMRALNLERKIQRAGGLSSWLASLGLDQFVQIFQGKSVTKFQLVNLTMKKLKDMGADAVGPRRKLMHAIDCLCQPYCFEVL